MTDDEKLILHIIKKKGLDKKGQKRIHADRRHYLMALLYYKYYWTEADIATVIGRDRSNVSNSKTKAYYYQENYDYQFSRTTMIYKAYFQYEFPNPEDDIKRKTLMHTILIIPENKKKLDFLVKKKDSLSIAKIINELIKEHL